MPLVPFFRIPLDFSGLIASWSCSKTSRKEKKRRKAVSIHGDKSQRDRTQALEDFKKRTPLLVATDVAARGQNLSSP